MITSAEERLHLDQADKNANWMENLCFFGFDEARSAGFLIHMKNRPNQGTVEFRFVARIGDRTCTYGSIQPIAGGFTYPDFTLECVETARHWKIQSSAKGWPIEAAGGVIGIPHAGDAPLGFEIDIDWTSTIPALDWAVMKDSKETDSAGSNHYDQGGRFAGKIRIGDDAVAVNALAYRDHSWGPRHFAQMKVARYVGFVTADMRTYYDGLFIDHGEGKDPVGFTYVIEDGAGHTYPRPEVSVLKGRDWDEAYDQVRIVSGDVSCVADTVWHVKMPLIPERYLSNVAMVRVTMADGRTGFGIVERGRLFEDHEHAEWTRAPGAKVAAQ